MSPKRARKESVPRQSTNPGQLIAYRTDPVCGAQVHPEHAAQAADWNGTTYSFDSDECRRRFADAPARYATPLARRSA